MPDDKHDKHFYVSFELNEVVNLVLEREKLLNLIVLNMAIEQTVNHSEATNIQVNEEEANTRIAKLTAKLETLIVKKPLYENETL